MMSFYIVLGIVFLLLFLFEKGKDEVAKIISFHVGVVGLG